MTTRYKSSDELTQKYAQALNRRSQGGTVSREERDEWVGLRSKEIQDLDPLSDEEMARFQAEAEFDAEVPDAIEEARLTRESLDRTRAQIASATVQQNQERLAAAKKDKWEEIVPDKA